MIREMMPSIDKWKRIFIWTFIPLGAISLSAAALFLLFLVSAGARYEGQQVVITNATSLEVSVWGGTGSAYLTPIPDAIIAPGKAITEILGSSSGAMFTHRIRAYDKSNNLIFCEAH